MSYSGGDDLLSRPRLPDLRETSRTGSAKEEIAEPGSGPGPILGRFFVYALVVGGALMLVFEAMRAFGIESLAKETGIIEQSQLIVLIGSAILLVSTSRRTLRASLLFTAALPLMALVRELDALLDIVYHGSWTVPFYALVAATVAFSIRNRRELVRDFPRFAGTRAFVMFFCGFLVVILISRIMGQQSVWRAALGEAYVRGIARIVEESLELVGYLIFLLGVVEARFDLLPRRERAHGKRDSAFELPASGRGEVGPAS